MNSHTKQDIRSALHTIAENHAATMTILQQTLSLLTDQLQNEAPRSVPRKPSTSKADPSIPTLDVDHLSVVYKGRSCFLGNSIPYRFIAKLIDRPNRYFSYQELLDDVWQCVVTDDAVRSVVKVLRAKLRKSRLDELAEAIDGSVVRHYGLMLTKRDS